MNWQPESGTLRRDPGGSPFGQIPTNQEVLQTLRKALQAVKTPEGRQLLTRKAMDTCEDLARKEQIANGYHDGPGGLKPRIPKSTYANR